MRIPAREELSAGPFAQRDDAARVGVEPEAVAGMGRKHRRRASAAEAAAMIRLACVLMDEFSLCYGRIEEIDLGIDVNVAQRAAIRRARP